LAEQPCAFTSPDNPGDAPGQDQLRRHPATAPRRAVRNPTTSARRLTLNCLA
jgi:hypothetical protein